MSNVLHQEFSKGLVKTLASGWSPVSLHFKSSEHTIVKFTNGEEVIGTCLRCRDTPCATLNISETISSNLAGFPSDRNIDVCAAGAITIPDSGGPPNISNDLCILCGACSSRCPVGAIRLVAGVGAQIEDEPNKAFIYAELISEEQDSVKAVFKSLKSDGILLIESDSIVHEVFTKLYKAWARVGDRFPNMLARNLLIGAGVEAVLGRKGNNHMRMDILLSSALENGVAEVEFGADAVLDAPRDMMDALAILVSRYDWNLLDTSAVVISDVLPNRRSEYWDIIQDIRNVLSVNINTVTVFGLMLLNWNRLSYDLKDGNLFYADRSTKSYQSEVLEALIGRSLNLGNTPRPQVDIAK